MRSTRQEESKIFTLSINNIFVVVFENISISLPNHSFTNRVYKSYGRSLISIMLLVNHTSNSITQTPRFNISRQF